MLLPLLFLTSLKTCSQTITVNNKNDTALCFSLSQAKFLLKQHYRVAELTSLDSVCHARLVVKDSISLSQKRIIAKHEKIIKNQLEIITLKDYELQKTEQALVAEQKKVRRQKVYKWVAVIAGGATTSFMGYMYLKK